MDVQYRPGPVPRVRQLKAFTNRSTAAPFTVSDGVQILGTASINQQIAPSQLLDDGTWFDDLGVFNVFTNTLTVTLTNNVPTGLVIADAIRIDRLSDVVPSPEISVSGNGTDIVINAGSLVSAPFPRPAGFSGIHHRNDGTTPLLLTGPVSLPAGYSLTPDFGSTCLLPGKHHLRGRSLDTSIQGTFAGEISFWNQRLR
ncbi:MAG: hypothetical protein R3C49_04530 [Planctomycetaceae bacterium]